MMDFLPSDLFYQQSDMNNIFNGEDELSDDDGYSQVGERIGGGGEKKRRLKLEQVEALEKSFELGNKLEPERKLQLAKALGLHPRQIAIWFQNRRARWKTKQLEKDYALLKKQFEALKAHNHSLQSHNTKLHNQLQALKSREPTGTASINPEREAEDSRSHGTEGNSDIIHVSRTPPSTNGIVPSHQFSGKHILSQSLGNPSSIAQLLQGSTETDTIQCPNTYEMVRDDSLICNMLGGIEDRPGLWSWPGQHHFN